MSTYTDKRVLEQLDDLKKYVVLNEIQSKDIITAEEAAAILGKSLSTLYKYTAKGIIPHFKPSRKSLYFKRSDLEKWMCKNPVGYGAI